MGLISPPVLYRGYVQLIFPPVFNRDSLNHFFKDVASSKCIVGTGLADSVWLFLHRATEQAMHTGILWFERSLGTRVTWKSQLLWLPFPSRMTLCHSLPSSTWLRDSSVKRQDGWTRQTLTWKWMCRRSLGMGKWVPGPKSRYASTLHTWPAQSVLPACSPTHIWATGK